MNVSLLHDLPPLDDETNGACAERDDWRFFTAVIKSPLDDDEEEEEEEEEDEIFDGEFEDEDDDDEETERRWEKDARIKNSTRIDVCELIDELYDENREINLTTARSKSYVKKLMAEGCSKQDALVIFCPERENEEDDEDVQNNNNTNNNSNESEAHHDHHRRRSCRRRRRRQRNRSIFVPFYIAHVFRRCGHTGPIKVLLNNNKKNKMKRGSTTVEEKKGISSVSMKGTNDNQFEQIYDKRIVSVYDLLQNLTTQRLQVIDTRSEAFFLGRARREAKKTLSSTKSDVERAGHIPSSINVPHSRLRPFDNEHNIAVFEDRGVDVTAPCAVIGGHMCSSAPFVAAMLENLGLKEVFIVESSVDAWRCEDGGSYPLFNPNKDSSSMGRVIIWSVTRGRSTALERAFAQHPKIMVMHELLTEPYLKENTPGNYEKIKNGQQTLNVSSSGCSYSSVMELMMTDYSSQGKPYYLSKELSCYFDQDKCTDEWLRSFHHVVLVRNPSDALKSFYRVGLNQGVAESLYFDPTESGFKECKEILERLDSIKGKYMVVDADLDLMANPEETLKQICAFASIAFNKNMLAWEPKELDSWKKFRGWHTDAVNSTGLAPPVRSASFEIEYPEEVFNAVEEAMPYYTFCVKRR